jgi:pimeloyl-ACP methyl ester carboxylesterase
MGNAVNGILFQPPEPSYLPDPNLIWLNTRSNERIACFFLNRGAPLTVLFSHGNAEDLGMILHYFQDTVPDLPCNIFAYDYAGYGHSSGSPSEAEVYSDIETCFLYLRDVLGIPWEQIVLFGRSLGSAASTHLAALTPVRGIILQCPMLSLFRIAFNSNFSLPGDQLTTVDRLERIEAPTLVIHGTDDEIVPFWHGVEIYKGCRNKSVEPYWVDGGEHNNLEIVDNPEFVRRIVDFLRHLESDPIDEILRNQLIKI